MEIADVRKRILETMERARRAAAERRARSDEAGREYEVFLERTAVPLMRQIANVLRAHGYGFDVFTPGGSVRLMSDKAAEDFIELFLDATGDGPRVMVRTSRARGRRVVSDERPIGSAGPIRDLAEEDVLAVVLKELEPFVER